MKLSIRRNKISIGIWVTLLILTVVWKIKSFLEVEEIDYLETDFDKVEISVINRTRSDARQLLYNRVPKAASTTFQRIMHESSKRNDFLHGASNTYHVRSITPKKQLSILHHVRLGSKDWISYDRHFYYINATNFDYKIEPIYINIIRDPVDRFVSNFYFRRSTVSIFVQNNKYLPQSWLNKNLNDCFGTEDPECRWPHKGESIEHQLTYFCGQDLECQIVGSRKALKRAMSILETKYTVVGTVEDFKMSIEVMEAYLPRYFKGATDFYKSIVKSDEHQMNSLEYPPISNRVREGLRRQMNIEYEFYNFARNRLKLQHRYIQNLSKS